MKKIISLFLAFFAAAFISCSSGGDGSSSPQANITASNIVGKWIYTGSGEDGPAVFSMLLIFDTGSKMETYLLTGPSSTEYFVKCATTYSVSANKLTINAANCEESGKIKQTESDFVVNNNELTITDKESGDNITFQKWNGDIAALTPVKSQTLPDDTGDKITPQISLNAYPLPHNFLFYSAH